MHDQEPLVGGPKDGPLVILIHGRGGSASDNAAFAEHHLPSVRYVALQADDHTWYPNSFLRPKEDNEPKLSAALKAIDEQVKDPENTYILGFSQGACLAAEYAARNPKRYAGLFILSGGLIGETPQGPQGSLQGTPVVIGCSEKDPYIPLERVHETAESLKDAGADVRLHTYPGGSHTITAEELSMVRSVLKAE